MAEPYEDATRRGYIEDGRLVIQEEQAEGSGDDGYAVRPYGALVGLRVEIEPTPNWDSAQPIGVELRLSRGKVLRVVALLAEASILVDDGAA